MAEGREQDRGRARVTTVVHNLDELVAAHPSALAEIFGRGSALDPAELGDAPRGVLLAFVGGEPVHLLARPLARVVSSGAARLWQGVRFDHGGNSGVNVVFGQSSLRFRTELGPSSLDGGPALGLLYDRASFPWNRLRDELRRISPGIAIGPTFVGGRHVGWFGLSR